MVANLQVSYVKVSPDFRSLNVFWIAQGSDNDLHLENILKSMAFPLRHELSQLRLMGEVPRIFFVKDKLYSKGLEIDNLLRKADFGEDFVPTDITLFMKSNMRLQIKFPEEVKAKLEELEQSLSHEDYEEEELPEMRHDVLGLDHSMIMKKIVSNMDKTKKAWEAFETRSEYILASSEPTKDFTAAQMQIDKSTKEKEIRDDFVKFLERKQFAKRTPERKKHQNYFSHEDENISDEYSYHDQIDDDYLEDDHELKK